MNAFTDVNEALEYVKGYSGQPEDLRLPISESLQDPLGANMAIITDALLARDFEPNGFEQEDGYRVYRYKQWDTSQS